MKFGFEDLYGEFPAPTRDYVHLVAKGGVGGYYAIGLQKPSEKEWVASFCIHEAELRHLIKELQDLVDGKSDYITEEGITLGGLPEKEDLMEYRETGE